MSVTSIEETNLAIEELEEEIRRENDRRYAFYRMLNATDRVLWRLEELNERRVKTVPGKLRELFLQALAEVPTSCLEAYRDSDLVQEVLDSIFEVQERLFAWHDPTRLPDEDYVEEVMV